MESQEIVTMVFGIIGGLGIFLLGMKNLSEGMQAVAGERLRRLINAATSNRLIGTGVGTLVTSIIQSSSITTVLTVGMVNAGLMTLTQAISIVLGANIGTTVTAWILVLDFGKYGLPTLGLAAIVMLFSRNERVRYSAIAFIGLGMVFFGLTEMKDAFEPLRHEPAFIEWFKKFTPDTYFGVLKCVLAGAILTAIVQSSSATVGITIGLASEGLISYEAAAALVLGENIGTTITAWLASLGLSTTAKRASYAHIMFNVLGVAWITAIFGIYIKGVLWVAAHYMHVDLAVLHAQNPDAAHYATYIGACIAATHTGFNCINVVLFLPFTNQLARFLEFIVPDKSKVETPRLTYLDIRMFDTPAIGIEQSLKGIYHMADTVGAMYADLEPIVEKATRDEELVAKIFRTEEMLDIYQKEEIEFLSHLLKGNVPYDVMEEGRGQLRMADEYESIGDYTESLLKLNLRMQDIGESMSPEGHREMLTLHKKIGDYLALIRKVVELGGTEAIAEAHTRGDAITHTIREMRNRHFERVRSGEASPLKSLVYTDMLNAYRRIKDHGINIVEVAAGEK